MTAPLPAILLTAAALLPTVTLAAAEIESSGTTISGQQELPKVLYVVPWKRSSVGDLLAPQTTSLVADLLDPLDPDLFKRRIQYFDLMNAEGRPRGK